MAPRKTPSKKLKEGRILPSRKTPSKKSAAKKVCMPATQSPSAPALPTLHVPAEENPTDAPTQSPSAPALPTVHVPKEENPTDDPTPPPQPNPTACSHDARTPPPNPTGTQKQKIPKERTKYHCTNCFAYHEFELRRHKCNAGLLSAEQRTRMMADHKCQAEKMASHVWVNPDSTNFPSGDTISRDNFLDFLTSIGVRMVPKKFRGNFACTLPKLPARLASERPRVHVSDTNENSGEFHGSQALTFMSACFQTTAPHPQPQTTAVAFLLGKGRVGLKGYTGVRPFL